MNQESGWDRRFAYFFSWRHRTENPSALPPVFCSKVALLKFMLRALALPDGTDDDDQ